MQNMFPLNDFRNQFFEGPGTVIVCWPFSNRLFSLRAKYIGSYNFFVGFMIYFYFYQLYIVISLWVLPPTPNTSHPPP